MLKLTGYYWFFIFYLILFTYCILYFRQILTVFVISINQMISFLKRKSFILSFAVLASASIFFCSKFLLPLKTVIFEESYLQQCSYLDINILSIINSWRIPFWSFHFGGGYPFIQHPENISLSPLFYLLVLPFGSAIGMKLMIMFAYFTGIFGMLVFCRKILKFNILASIFSSSIFIFSSFIPFQINTGNTRDPGWLYLPLLLFLITKAVKNIRYIFFSSLLIVLMLFSGFNLYLAPAFLFLFIYAILEDTNTSQKDITLRKRDLLTPRFFVILLISFFLGAVKIIPLLELLSHNSRSFDVYAAASTGAMTFNGFFTALLAKGPFAVGNESIAGPNGLGMGCVFFFGYIPLSFFVCSIVICFRKIWKYLLLFILFTILAMADNFPIDIFNLLWHIPLFNSIHEPARYFGFPMVFTFSIISGAVLNSSLLFKKNRIVIAIVSIMALYSIVNMYASNSLYFDFTGRMQIRPPAANWKEHSLFNVRTIPFSKKLIPDAVRSKVWAPSYRQELVPGLQCFLVRRNIGLINWFGNIKLEEDATEKYRVTLGYGSYWKDLRMDRSLSNGVIENNAYKGESYFYNTPSINHIHNIDWQPNEIIIDIDQSTPDILIINQNFNKNWQVTSGKLINKNGLLAVFLDSPIKGTISFTYRPLSFLIGLTVSLLTFSFCLFRFFIKKRSQ